MHRTLLAIVVVGGLLLTAAPLSTAQTAPEVAAAAEAELLALVNGERAAAGLTPLAVDGALAAGSRAWALELASRGALAHDGGWTVDGASAWAENVGRGPDAASVHRSFMASADHRANILRLDFTAVGIGAAVQDGVLWVVERFAAVAIPEAPEPVDAPVEAEAAPEPEPALPLGPEPAPLRVGEEVAVPASPPSPDTDGRSEDGGHARSSWAQPTGGQRADARPADGQPQPSPASSDARQRAIDPPAATETPHDHGHLVGGHGQGPAAAQGEERSGR